MTRRGFIPMAAAAAVPTQLQAPLVLPVYRLMDSRAQCAPEQLQGFWSGIWPEAYRDFQRAGIQLQTSDGTGEIRRSPGDRPIFTGLRRGVINLVLTDHLPMKWDKARALPGVSTLYEGHHLCVIALRYAHGHQIPFLSVNTCVHELLHAVLQDIYKTQPEWHRQAGYEFRIDWLATQLWLFGNGAAVRRGVQEYLKRLRPA